MRMTDAVPRILAVTMAAIVAFCAAAAMAQDADLLVSKSGPAIAAANTDVSYDIMITNLGPNDSMTVSLTDPLPPGMTFVSMNQNSGPAFSCSGPMPGAGGTVTCTIATLVAGTTADFTLIVHIPPGTPPGTSFTNQATVAATNDPNVENDTSVAVTSTPPPPQADVSVTKSGPPSASPNTDVNYSITVLNSGPDPASMLTLSDSLPANETFVSFTQTSGPAFTCTTGATNTCTIASLAVGSAATFTFVAHVTPGTGSGVVIQNTATVSSANDPNSENDTSTTALTVATADLAITKTGPPTATAGMTMSWTITVSNAGPDDAQNARLDESFSASATFVSLMQSSGPAAICTTPAPGTNGVLSCSWASFATGSSAAFVLTAAVASGAPAGSVITNNASFVSDSGDTNTGNNAATTMTTVATQADVGVTKSAPPGVVAGQNATFTIDVVNNGPSDAQTVVLTDPVPANATFVSEAQTNGPAFTCTTPPVGATGMITCNSSSLAAGATATFSIVVKVNSSATGSVVNTASVSTATTDSNAA
ncbi:MAG TPA: hypothetical protein VGK04_09075, partial [Thermoanaerobaculia bacterium]